MQRQTLAFLIAISFLSLPLCEPANTFAQPREKQLVQPAEFVAFSSENGFKSPRIVVQFDPQTGTGFDYKLTENRPWYDDSEAARVGAAVDFLREGIERLSGQRLEVISSNDLTRGIVLTTLSGATDEIRNDPDVQAALQNDGSDSYNHREAFFIRSEQNRILLVANSVDGLVTASAELLESVGYEVLGMGPNWVFVPASPQEAAHPAGTVDQASKDQQQSPTFRERLAFRLQTSGRPSYYIRALIPTSGQSYGVGTILDPKLLSDPVDETVDVSLRRWQIGRRMRTQSMPSFPGHALQSQHRAVISRIRETGNTDGFLATVRLGLDAERPPAADTNSGWLWINSDPLGQPEYEKVFLSNGKQWQAANLAEVGVNLDLSVKYVREIVLETLKTQSEDFFAKNPNGIFIFGTDPEDGGGYAELAALLKHPSWYPEYLAEAGIDFGQPYVLHGFHGLNQPREIWDATAPSDIVFGFNNWLLHEYDRWIASLPAEQQVTTTGRAKGESVRCSLYSYNYHDVPPNFNLDPRIRLMIASYPKHRGRGKWKQFANQTDLARAFRVMLPREPSGDYWIISLSYYWDRSLEGLQAPWDASPAFLVSRQREHYDAGFRALNCETDFNFGRLGLGYYLISQLLWNTRLNADELDAIRDRWLQRAFGAGWQPMKQYYDFMLTENYPVNSPRAWAQAIRYLEAADQQINAAHQPAAQRRLDDLKQYWYFYYLVDMGEDNPSSAAMRELVWKGQMSYANALHMVTRTIFGTNSAADAAGPEIAKGPAHFTRGETQTWWPKLLEHWPLIPVTLFADATLANGRAAREIDLRDLVPVKDFGLEPCPQAFLYNSGYMPPPTFLCSATQAGQKIGFQLYWPADPTGKDGYYIARDLPYGISCWNSETKSWDQLVDKTLIKQPSVEIQLPDNDRQHHLVRVSYDAPRPGTYRFEIGYGGNLSLLTDLGFDPATNKHTAGASLTFDGTVAGLTQSPAYFYIPQGTKSLDLEVWDAYGAKFVELYKSMPPTPANRTREVDISQRRTHRIELAAEEAGAIAVIRGNGFAFPYLYSVPLLWSKSPSQLLVPRSIAEADGLEIAREAR